MKRHSFALTILLASLATPLLTVGSARCQSGPPAPRNQCEVCPLLEDYCNDYDYYYGYSDIATAQHDNELLDPRFDPETGRYVGHDEVKTVADAVQGVATDCELDEFYAACEDTCNAEVHEAYTAETVIEEVAVDTRYDEEYYSDEYADDYDYNYDYESYDYDYEAADYWYEEAADVSEEAVTQEVAEEAYNDSYDYDYGYDEYDNYDYEYETYDYEAYDYEAEVAAEYAAAEAAAALEAREVDPNPPVPPQEALALEVAPELDANPPVAPREALALEDDAVAADAWDYEAEGYDPYAYDYEAYEYEYEVYENGAVATPVETAETEELTSENEADFADTWTDSVEDYSYQYDYDYDYGVDYEYQPEVETVQVEPADQISPLASAVSRQALLGAANLLDGLSQVLKNASAGLERTASVESNIR